jgi:threonine dehydrogenase-like Zn-dependent dehydrogenase
VPDDLSDRAAIIAASPLSNGIRWAEATDAPAGGHIAIIGPGPQGLSCAIAAIDAGYVVTVVGLPSDKDRLARAATFGARTHVIEPATDPEASARALQDRKEARATMVSLQVGLATPPVVRSGQIWVQRLSD